MALDPDPRERAERSRAVRRTGRGEQRRQALLDAALAVFLEQGYERASIEEVMRRVGGGSKASLYSYFGSKEGLFWEVLGAQCDRFMQDLALPTVADDDPGATLTAVARRYMRQLGEPASRELYRIMIAEAPRFPDLARRFYEQGAERVRDRLGRYLELQHRAGRVVCPEPLLAAMQFFELLKAPHLRMMLGLPPLPRGLSLDRHLKSAVRIFLYGCANREVLPPPPPGDRK